MKSLWKCLIQSSLAVVVSVCVPVATNAQDAGQEGIVRISKPRTSDVIHRRVTPVSAMMTDGTCVPPAAMPSASAACGAAAPMTSAAPAMMCEPGGMCDGQCNHGRRKYHRQDWRYSDWQAGNALGSSLHVQTQAHSRAFERALGYSVGSTGPCTYYHDPSGQAMLDYFKCKFGYFIPTGGGGQGVPWVGKYARVYPVNPAYSDPRDGQTWAAQGYGVPLAVPLAPVVGHTYDYGWGVPSSRLTPVSNPAY